MRRARDSSVAFDALELPMNFDPFRAPHSYSNRRSEGMTSEAASGRPGDRQGQAVKCKMDVMRGVMKERRLTLLEIGAISGTRAMAGAGLALLLADKLSRKQRKAVGWTLFLAGTAIVIPLVINVLGRSE